MTFPMFGSHCWQHYRKTLILCLLWGMAASLFAQMPLRPDAFPPQPETKQVKALVMASTLDELRQWNAYPTYDLYVAFMQHLADDYESLCHLDTIGISAEGRLILALQIAAQDDGDTSRPEFFYSATIHGDEVLPYYLMLRLADSLLSSYGSSQQITRLLQHTRIVINPLANPDGTYHGGNHTLSSAWRYNANGVDLNRNFPDPFGATALDTLQTENRDMINYVSSHRFRMSANLHSGAEVLNYPWDSFTSTQSPHPDSRWWQAVCKRFADTVHHRNNNLFRQVASSGYIAGGDWYVIRNGRQDYMNYYHGIRELTLEVSNVKLLSNSRLNPYWAALSQSLINYIEEVLYLDNNPFAVSQPQPSQPRIYPNPTRGMVYIDLLEGRHEFDFRSKPAGVYPIRFAGHTFKVIKY